jgi:hypothetical protein
MNIDELAAAIEAASPNANGRELAVLLRNWKSTSETAERLSELVERYIGHTWFETEAVNDAVYSLWSNFRDEAIGGIDGMTMNERLYCFGLFERFDHASVNEREEIYAKLHAHP